jgi:hypothetical protein
MQHAWFLSVLEEDLAAFHDVAFINSHAGLHARKVVGYDGNLGARCRASDDLKRFSRNREVEALHDLMQCHVCSVSVLGRIAADAADSGIFTLPIRCRRPVVDVFGLND